MTVFFLEVTQNKSPLLRSFLSFNMPLSVQWAVADEPDLEDEFSLGLRFIGFYRMEGTQTDNLIKPQQKRNDFITIEILFLVFSISDS